MAVAAGNCPIIEIRDSQVSTQSEDYESQGREVPETQSQGIKGEDDDLAICPDDTLWTTGHAIRAISPPPRRPVGGQEDEWRDHEEDREAEHENPYTHTQVARSKMAGNTPWASQLFPDPTQESVPASLVTGDEPYSAKLANFTDALTQLPDTQGQSQETDATEEDGAEGQQSSCPRYGRQDNDIRTLVATEGTSTVGREVTRVEVSAQTGASAVEEVPQNPPPGGPQLQKTRGSEDGGAKEQQHAAVGACRSQVVGHRSQDTGASKCRREEEAGTSDEWPASKRLRREEQQDEQQAGASSSLEPPAGAAVDVVGAFAERLMKGLLDLGSEHGVAASMTVTADRVVLEVRLDRSQRGGTL
ncbi:hypothetical protein F5883DRAFT_686252 [Diaporthe sp. PMI_573]|nr:hypothetical protein F5883DRAFT_686252 [Diaporthaceae sp. PMI_573]